VYGNQLSFIFILPIFIVYTFSNNIIIRIIIVSIIIDIIIIIAIYYNYFKANNVVYSVFINY